MTANAKRTLQVITLETPLHHHSCSRMEAAGDICCIITAGGWSYSSQPARYLQLANNSQRQENTASHHLETPLHHHSCSRVEVQLANNSQRQENTASHHLETPLHHHSCSRVEVQLANNSQRMLLHSAGAHTARKRTRGDRWPGTYPVDSRSCEA
jgi:hypothetical protein